MSEAEAPQPYPYIERLSEGEVRHLERLHAVSGIVPSWGGQYPPCVIPAERDRFKVRDLMGREMWDAHQGILSSGLGWRNPEVEAAVAINCDEYPGLDMVDTTQLFVPAVLLKRDLAEALRPYGAFRILLASSGTAANNQALRLCIGALEGINNVQLIVFEGAYGGADLEMNALCQVPGWKGLTSLMSDALVIKRDGSNIDDVLSSIPPGKKPLLHTEDGQQGVGGFYPINPAVMRYLMEEITRRGGLKILDDVQTFVRNGHGLIGFDRWADPTNPAHRPDAITLAKALGNGRAAAAAAVSEHVLEAVRDSGHPGATFDTNSQPRDGIAAARRVLRIVQDQRLWTNVSAMGNRFRHQLDEIAARQPDLVEAVVGEGGLIGVQFRTVEQIKAAMSASPGKGLLFAKGGLEGTVARLPLTFNADKEFVDEVSQRFEDTLNAVRAAA